MSTELSKGANIGAWVLSALLAAAFVMAGGSKLAGVEMHVQNFARWGFPSWFLYVTGGIEVASALGLLWRRTAGLAALGLVATMVGAVLTHLKAGEAQMVVAPVVLGLMAGAVAYLRRDSLKALKPGGA